MATIRVATVTATGEKYVVQQVLFSQNKVFVWGNLRSFKIEKLTGRAHSSKFETGRAFLLSAVDLAEVDFTAALGRELLAQTANAQRAAGHVVTQSARGNYRDHGTPAQKSARDNTRALTREMRKEIRGAIQTGDTSAILNLILSGGKR